LFHFLARGNTVAFGEVKDAKLHIVVDEEA
jgi:hypothetical protein